MATETFTVAPGTRVLHVGPHKTGTTTLQGAFHLARTKLREHGVVYAGKTRQPGHAAAAIAGGAPLGLEAPTLGHWEALCEEVAAAGDDRVVISSERFASADEDAARAVVEGLGGDRVHVVVTLRPLVKIMPSQWQEYIKMGSTRASYESWLEGMLLQEPFEKPTPSFWRRHRAHELVRRWAAEVGAENLTVVMVDEAEPLRILRVFEELVDLPQGILEPEDGGTLNRSLTWGEVELLRQLNQDVAKQSWPHPQWGKAVREQVAKSVRKAHRPTRDEPRITTPEWAVAEAVKVAEQSVEEITALGVRVVGDLSNFAKRPDTAPLSVAEPSVPAAAAAGAALGATMAGATLFEAQQKADAAKRSGDKRPSGPLVREMTSAALLGEVRRRAVRRLGGRRR